MNKKNNQSPDSINLIEISSKKQLAKYAKLLHLPQPDSHKGQNGKLLIIGGSNLFHAASKWSLDVASKLVDMVFYSSIPGNNQLIQQAKSHFWNGIVIPRQQVEDYLQEADCVLIGPGMERQQKMPAVNQKSLEKNQAKSQQGKTDPARKKKKVKNDSLTDQEWQHDTQKIVNYLLSKYPQKKWVIDAGALQMMDYQLLNEKCIITPHIKELNMILEQINSSPQDDYLDTNEKTSAGLLKLSRQLNQSTILLKGKIDTIACNNKIYRIKGGNAGMTKGGTGDVLAGLMAGLYCTNQILPSVITASWLNKAAGDKLYKRSGPFYNASDLVDTIPELLWKLIKKTQSRGRNNKKAAAG